MQKYKHIFLRSDAEREADLAQEAARSAGLAVKSTAALATRAIDRATSVAEFSDTAALLGTPSYYKIADVKAALVALETSAELAVIAVRASAFAAENAKKAKAKYDNDLQARCSLERFKYAGIAWITGLSLAWIVNTSRNGAVNFADISVIVWIAGIALALLTVVVVIDRRKLRDGNRVRVDLNAEKRLDWEIREKEKRLDAGYHAAREMTKEKHK